MKQHTRFWCNRAGFLLLAFSTALTGCTEQGTPGDQAPALAGKSTLPAGRDTICLTGPSLDCLAGFNGRSAIRQLLGPFTTNTRSDSVCWELVYASPGLSMEPKSGKGGHSMVTITRAGRDAAGQVVVRVCPYRSGFISRPYAFAVALQNNRAVAGKPALVRAEYRNRESCPPDTGIINREHRTKITEFSDLLFMFAKTRSALEREYFKTGAERKLNEIQGGRDEMTLNNDLGDLFTDPPATLPLVIPVYDTRRCYITGVRIRQP